MSEDKKANKQKLVVTYALNDWDVNGCIGVYDDFNAALGAAFGHIYDIAVSKMDRKFTTEFSDVDSYGNYFDIDIRWSDDPLSKDAYRIFFLNEKDCEEYDE